ncbi:hypothetical protein [Mesorhizobium sp. M0968]|uniref:hypothetical protein n=1 Tax=Mesorhizobium sp. M0968 TaxID=2957037 RepID=UPI003339D22C
MTPTLVHRYAFPVRDAIEQLLGGAAADCEAWRIRIEADELVIDVVAPIESQTPAGEKIRTAQGNAMETVPVTGQPPVGTVSPLNEAELKATPLEPPRKGGPLARQAGMMCGEKGFWTFIGKKFGVTVASADEAAAWLKAQCGVKSRVDFDYDDAKADNFREIDKAYRLWLEGYD